MIDTHAHLDACDEPDEVLERARAVGVSRVVTVGTGIDSCRAALELTERRGGVFAALGIDPHSAGSPDAKRLDELRSLLVHPKAVAVGETGLDDHHRHATLAEQGAVFQAQLDLACDLELPVVIHSRAASRATADYLAGFSGAVVLHCFSEPDLLATALDRQYYVSFAGNVTYPKAESLRQAAARVPADRILAETDSPFLAPQPVRGRQNEPGYLVHTLRVLADVRGEDPVELADRIDRNATAAFGLPEPE